MINPDTATLGGTFYSREFETAAATLTVEPITMNVRSVGDIESAITTLGQQPNSGLIVGTDTFTGAHRELIVTLASQHRVPAIYGFRFFPMSGGLMSYGPNVVDTCRRSASYIDRILRGEKPADLPIQAPTKFDFVINLKTASALGLTVPPSLLVRADEVIE